jgi:hypothetical protein
MKRTNLIKKSINLALSVLVAGSIVAVGADGSTIASVSSNDTILTTIVEAAEAQELTATGIVTYLQNDAGNPAPVFLANADGTYTLAMYKGTMVNFGVANLLATAGGVPMPLQTSAYAAFAPAGDGQGIVVAATEVGAEVIQFQNVVNGVPTGNVITVALNVVDAAGTAATASVASTQVAASAYSYADDHNIVSTDGMLELNLDGMTWHSSTTHKAPKIYYGADGVLTVEIYQGQGVNIPAVSKLSGYRATRSNCGYIGVGAAARGIKGTEIVNYTVHKDGKGYADPTGFNPSTQLPIRVVTLGSMHSDGGMSIAPADHGAIGLSK